MILGRFFTLPQVEELRKVCAGSYKDPIAWIVGEPAKAPGGMTGPPGPGYAEQAATEVKIELRRWLSEGAGQDGIILY